MTLTLGKIGTTLGYVSTGRNGKVYNPDRWTRLAYDLGSASHATCSYLSWWELSYAR